MPEGSVSASELLVGNEGLMSSSAGEPVKSALDPAVAARLKRDPAGLVAAIAQQ